MHVDHHVMTVVVQMDLVVALGTALTDRKQLTQAGAEHVGCGSGKAVRLRWVAVQDYRAITLEQRQGLVTRGSRRYEADAGNQRFEAIPHLADPRAVGRYRAQ